MTSPTATFCCLLPARTIAYTAVSFVGTELWVCRPGIVGPRHGARTSGRAEGHAGAHRGSMLRGARRTPQNETARPDGCPGRQPSASWMRVTPVDRRQAAVPTTGGPRHGHIHIPSPRRRCRSRARGRRRASPASRAQAAGTPSCTNADLTASYRTGATAPRAPSTAGSCCATPPTTPATPAATAGSPTSATATAPRSALRPGASTASEVATYVLAAGPAPAQPDRRDRGAQLPEEALPPRARRRVPRLRPERHEVAVRRAPDAPGAATRTSG